MKAVLSDTAVLFECFYDGEGDAPLAAASDARVEIDATS